MVSSTTRVIQVTNIAPQATKDQMQTLFGYLGKIDDIRLYPTIRDVSCPVQSRICYVKYYDSTTVNVAQHLTNTVFIDRALIVIPVQNGEIPDEHRALEMSSNGTLVPGLNQAEPRLPLHVVNTLEGVPPSQVIQTNDPALTANGLPNYPPLPAAYDSRKIEEIRRTILVLDVAPSLNSQQLVDFFGAAGEVKYLRFCERDADKQRHALVEFSEQESVVKALKLNGSMLEGDLIKLYHATQAISKPQTKSNEAAQREIEEAMFRVKEAQNLISAAIDPVIGMLSKDKRRSRSRSRRRSRSKSRSRRSHSRHRSRRSRSRSRHRSHRSRRSRSRSSRRGSKSRHSRSRSRHKTSSRSKRDRSKDKDKSSEKKKSDSKEVSKTPIVETVKDESNLPEEKEENDKLTNISPEEPEKMEKNETVVVVEKKPSESPEKKRSRSKERKRSRSKDRKRSRSKERRRSISRSRRSRDRKRSKSRDRRRSKSHSRKRSRSRDRKRSRSRDRKRSRSRDRKRSKSRDRRRSRSRDRKRSKSHERSRRTRSRDRKSRRRSSKSPSVSRKSREKIEPTSKRDRNSEKREIQSGSNGDKIDHDNYDNGERHSPDNMDISNSP